MTAQLAIRGVEDEGHVAVGAVLRVPAVEAEHLGGEAAAVQEEDGLPALPKCIGEGAPQGMGEHGQSTLGIALPLACQIHDLHCGQRASADAVAQDQAFHFAAVGGEARLQRRRRRAQDQGARLLKGRGFNHVLATK